MTNEEKKTWLLKNWRLINGKTMAKALKRYWAKEVYGKPPATNDLVKAAKDIFYKT